MRGLLAAGLLAVGVVAVAAVGTAGASGDIASLADLVGNTQQALDRLAAVQTAAESSNLNILRGAGGLAGLGLGVTIGSIATYVGWRR